MPPTSAELGHTASRLRRSLRVPAVGIGVIEGEADAHIAVSGLRARGRPDPVQRDDRWHIGSITKSMTALLLAALVAEARCGFDTGLGALAALPMHPALARCSLRELLAHRSGLRGNPPRAQCFPPGVQDHDAPEGAARDAMLAPALLQVPEPRAFAYSNLGYMLAGHIAEQLGGAPWKVLMQRRIAEPLGLDSFGFGPPPDDGPQGHMAWLTAIGRRSLQPRPGRAVARDAIGADLAVAMGPAGLVHLSLPDLLRYGVAVSRMTNGSDGIVPSALFRALIAGERYAGGWVLAPGALRHNGSNGLWFAELRIQPAQRRATAFVTNTGALPAMLAGSFVTSRLAKRMPVDGMG